MLKKRVGQQSSIINTTSITSIFILPLKKTLTSTLNQNQHQWSQFIMLLRSLLLLFLLFRWTESQEEVNPKALIQIMDIVNKIITNKITGRPYAVAINVPRNQCLDPENLEGLRKNLSRNETYRQQLRNSYSNEFDKATDIVAVFAVLSRVLLGIVLLSDIHSVANEEVDINTLARIQRFFYQKYVFIYENGQFAVAINVPKEQCRRGFIPSQKTFLTNDMLKNVKLYLQKKPVYRGTELIAAGHKKAHSEHLLMNPPNNSPLKHLLNKPNGGCVVFYTVLSPCVEKCLQSEVILAGLEELKKYQGMKAFVYTHIYNKDKDKRNLRDELKKIADRVPLYNCNLQCCVFCEDDVIDECLHN
ncbi:uncharacterized protein LOC130242041 [Danio aesculapii]|uniref:uncharacterized protein LOC130242041 n=1 Tax=Danio aesculapii TaxID=1142201 RepID=UPI0024C07685|nr:uncharacterized protein LOC130242041 [Danio aesculapii]